MSKERLRRGLINRKIMVMKRKKCGLFKKKIMIKRYKGGSDKMDEEIKGGEMLKKIV
jgi:hypothetical protein